MRRVRLANVANTTTAVPRSPHSRILPFTTSTRPWNTSTRNNAGEKQEQEQGEHNSPSVRLSKESRRRCILDSQHLQSLRATFKNDQTKDKETIAVHRDAESSVGSQTNNAFDDLYGLTGEHFETTLDNGESEARVVGDHSSLKTLIVAHYDKEPNNDNPQDDGTPEDLEALSSFALSPGHRVSLRNEYTNFSRALHHSRQAQTYPEAGIGFVYLSPFKDQTDLALFNSFWTMNFASISATYNMAYPRRLRFGKLFVLDRVAEKAAKIMDSSTGAPNELDLIRNMWEGQPDETKQNWWPTIMLWLLHNRPELAAKFLLASYIKPYPPFYMVSDALEYLASYYLQSSAKHEPVEAEYFRSLFYVLLDACVEARPSVTPKTVFLLATRSTLEQTIHLHETLHQKQIAVNYTTVLHFAYCYAKHGDFPKALSALNEAIAAGADPLSVDFLATCNKTLHCSVMHPDGYHASSHIVSRFIEMGVKLNQPLYSVLIVNAITANDMPTALRVLALLEENNVQPNAITYAILLNGYKRIAGPSQYFETTILQQAHECAIKSHDSWLATEILHCAHIHHQRGADGKPRDPITAFHLTLEVYRRYFRDLPLNALGILDSKSLGMAAGRTFMKPRTATITIMLTAYLRAYPERISWIYRNKLSWIFDPARTSKAMERRGELVRDLFMDDYTYNILLMAFSQDSRNLQHCTTLVQQMTKGLPEAILPRHHVTNEVIPSSQPTIWTWSILLHAFSRHGQTAAAEKVMDLMRKRGIQPVNVTWNSLLKGFAFSQDISGVVGALMNMEADGFDADTFTIAALKTIKNRDRFLAAWEGKRKQRDVSLDDGELEGEQYHVEGISDERESESELDIKTEGKRPPLLDEKGFLDSPAW